MEWLLPWWWERYSSCNELPVVFGDLGMTDKALEWCRNRGDVITITNSFSPDIICKEWQEKYGATYGQARTAWFKKPLLCLLTPFDETVWIDLDCEVLSPIEPVFAFLKEKEVAVMRTDNEIPEGFAPKIEGFEKPLIFNGGVIVFRKESKLMQEWARISLTESHLYWGDDYILSHLVYQLEESVELLPPIYNWRLEEGVPFYAKIIHWSGEWGKSYIATRGGLKGILKDLPDLKRVFSV